MSGSRDRRDRDRDPRPSDPRDQQPDEEQQRRPGDPDLQESDSLTALKAVLGKVASLLTSMQLTQDECISLVEQLYGSVLDMDVKLAGETDDKRKGSILAHVQNTAITRNGGKLVVEYPKPDAPKPAAAAAAPDAPDEADAPAAPAARPKPEAQRTPEAATAVVAEVQPEAAPAEPAVSETSPQLFAEPVVTEAPDPEPAAAEPAVSED
jgi:hypothetical protein